MATVKASGRAASIPVGLALGAAAGLAVTLAGSAGAAWMVSRGHFAPEWTGYCAMVILLLSSAVGAAVTIRKTQRLRAQMGLAAGAVYYLILVAMTALCFGGQYRGMGVTALMVLCGSGLVILLAPGSKNRAGCRRRRKRL